LTVIVATLERLVHVQNAAQQPQQARVQAMMSRILNSQWAIPTDVPISSECRDLLQRLLDPNPARRITMPQISQHPWFLQNLPPVRLSEWAGVIA
jgi:serine/threonine protein kinase